MGVTFLQIFFNHLHDTIPGPGGALPVTPLPLSRVALARLALCGEGRAPGRRAGRSAVAGIVGRSEHQIGLCLRLAVRAADDLDVAEGPDADAVWTQLANGPTLSGGPEGVVPGPGEGGLLLAG